MLPTDFMQVDLIYSRLRDDYRAFALDTKSQHAGRGVTSNKYCEPVKEVSKENKGEEISEEHSTAE